MALFTAVFAALIPFIVLFANGYRLGDGLKIVQTGGIYVYVPESETSIYINEVLKQHTGNFQKELFAQNYPPGEYHVAVEHPDYLPWEKSVAVNAQEVTALYPFLIPQTYVFREIKQYEEEGRAVTDTEELGENKEYVRVKTLFENAQKEKEAATAQTENEKPADKNTEDDMKEQAVDMMERGKTAIWIDGKTIMAKWTQTGDWMPQYFCFSGECTDMIEVVKENADVRTLAFYPSRDDVVIYSTARGVHVAEIDKRPTQTKQEIFSGKDTDVLVSNNGNIFIRDETRFYEIEL